MDDVVKKIYNYGLGCNLSFICTSAYTVDILLLSPSVRALKTMLLIFKQELLSLDLCLNHNKSVCIRVGPCFNANCVKLTTNMNGLIHVVISEFCLLQTSLHLLICIPLLNEQLSYIILLSLKNVRYVA